MTFTDERGAIEDLVGPVDCITRIFTAKGAVRGNHVHEHTTQWTFVISGVLLIASAGKREMVHPGEMVVHEPGTPHAWQALTDADCLVFTRGPRGEDYESDTIRLKDPLL